MTGETTGLSRKACNGIILFMYSTGIAYLLWLLSGFGALGFHRFYLGKIPTGLLWMCTGGLFAIGSIYDFFTLSSQVRDANLLKALYAGERKQFRPAGTPDWRYAEDAKSRVVNSVKENLEQAILKIAKENKGILTVSEVALGAEVSMEEAKSKLEALVSKGYAELRVRKSGTLVYVISDLADTDEPLEDF